MRPLGEERIVRHFIPLLLACACAAPALAEEEIPPVVGGHTWTQHRLEGLVRAHPQVAWIRVEGRTEGADRDLVFGDTRAIGSVLKPAHGDRPTGPWHLIRKPFLNNSGHEIGSVLIAFRKPEKSNTVAADRIAATLARSTLSAKNAVDPWPYSARFRGDRYAQKLVDRFVAAHPELLVMMIHATPPAAKTNIVIGSNIGRIGKAADEDDLRVIEKGSTNLEVADSGDRFETELPLNDASGKRIGALGLVFKLGPSDDKDALHARGRAIRDALAREIPDNAALFAPAGQGRTGE
jgi:hypothetical protein